MTAALSHSVYKRLGDHKAAALDLTRLPEGWLLTRVQVPHEYRGQGVARQMMAEVLDWADQHDYVLYVVPSPYSDSPMNRDQLQEWYERCGFVAGATPESLEAALRFGAMRRAPRTPAGAPSSAAG